MPKTALLSVFLLLSIQLLLSPNAATADLTIDSVFGYERTKSYDSLIMRNDDVIQGKAIVKSITIHCTHGKTVIPHQLCAGLRTHPIDATKVTTITTTYNKLSGKLDGETLLFTPQGASKPLPISIEDIQFLIFAKHPNEEQNIMQCKNKAALTLLSGEVLTGLLKNTTLQLKTAYASLDVRIGDIAQLEVTNHKDNACVIELRNKDTFTGTVANPTITFTHDIGKRLVILDFSSLQIMRPLITLEQLQTLVDSSATAEAPLPAYLAPVSTQPVSITAKHSGGCSDAVAVQTRWVSKGLPCEVEITGTTIALRLVPPGVYAMGSADDDRQAYADELPQHSVTLSRVIYVGKHEITQGQWMSVMKVNPSKFSSPADAANLLPVEQVSWNACQEFLRCLRLSIGAGDELRLLTEAEAEYACRSGAASSQYGALDDIAWYANNSGGQTRKVGGKLPNAWGLHDMIGNVWEWCEDWYGAYEKQPLVNPHGASTGESRVLRSGGYRSSTRNSRSANRFAKPPDYFDETIGLRIAVELH